MIPGPSLTSPQTSPPRGETRLTPGLPPDAVFCDWSGRKPASFGQTSNRTGPAGSPREAPCHHRAARRCRHHIGIGVGHCRPSPSHTTRHAGPHRAVAMVEVVRPVIHESFAVRCPLALVGGAFYPVLVHRLTASVHASSPHSVAVMQLRFTSFVVTNLRWDLHPQECAHAGRTKKTRRPQAPCLL